MSDSDYAWLFGGLLAVAGVGLIRTLKIGCVSPIAQGGRLAVVGDSLMVGMGPYFKTLARQYGMDTVGNHSKVGTTTAQWASSNLQAPLVPLQPTLILVSLGTNDAKTTYTQEQLAQQISTLKSQLESTGATVVWILPPTLPFSDRGFSELVKQTGVRVFESSKLEIPRGPDLIHPSAAGYAGWAGAVWQELLCDSSGPAPQPVAMSGYARPKRKKKRSTE